MPKTSPKKASKASAAKPAKPTAASSAARPRSVLSRRIMKDITLGALFAELVGTFTLTAAVLTTSGNVIIAALTVIIMVMALSKVSGGHVNPAVTIAQLATRQISWVTAVGYVIAQVLGAMLALVVITQFVHTAPLPAVDPNSMLQAQTPKVFTTEALVGHWRPVMAEFLGALVFGIGIAAAKFGKKEGIEAGFVVGGSLFLGLILATQGSSAIVNPAVAIGVSAYDFSNWWTVAAYALGPIAGAAAGAWLYKLLQWDAGTKTAEV